MDEQNSQKSNFSKDAEMNSKPCNVVLLPSVSLADLAIRVSNSVKSDTALFTLEDGAYYPHISMYMLELKVEVYNGVKSVLEQLSASFSAFNLTANKYDQKMGFLDAEYKVSTELARLQNNIIGALNPLRNGMREKDKQRMQQADGIKREYFELYGYANVKQLFRPHITLTRFDNDEPYDTTSLPEISKFNGVYDRLAFFESGNNGTCTKLISSYKLS